MARGTAQGVNKKEIMRRLKRYVARELFALIVEALTPTNEDKPTAPARARAT